MFKSLSEAQPLILPLPQCQRASTGNVKCSWWQSRGLDENSLPLCLAAFDIKTIQAEIGLGCLLQVLLEKVCFTEEGTNISVNAEDKRLYLVPVFLLSHPI